MEAIIAIAHGGHMQDRTQRRDHGKLEYGDYDDETAAAEYELARVEKQETIDLLAKLPVSQRRAQLQRDVRREGELRYHESIHAEAERAAQRARNDALPYIALRYWMASRSRAERGARSAKSRGQRSTSAGGGDGEPEPPPIRDSNVVTFALSRNAKLGKGRIYQTTVSIEHTCPSSCLLRDNGCYAQRGFVAAQVARRQFRASAAGYSDIDIARAEARLITERAQTVTHGTPLRLHVAGDAKSDAAARIISEACAEWPGPVFTFTHAWRDVARDAWGSVSVFASIERPEDAAVALQRGYAPALVVPAHSDDGRPEIINGVKYTPCTFQVESVSCVDHPGAGRYLSVTLLAKFVEV